MHELYGIKLFYDRRIKVGKFLPTKDGRSYRMHPDTRKLLDEAIAKANRSEIPNVSWRSYYQPKIELPKFPYLKVS